MRRSARSTSSSLAAISACCSHEDMSSMPRHRVHAAQGQAGVSGMRQGNDGRGVPPPELCTRDSCLLPLRPPRCSEAAPASCNHCRSIDLPCGSSSVFSPRPCRISRRSGPGPQTPATIVDQVCQCGKGPATVRSTCAVRKSSSPSTQSPAASLRPRWRSPCLAKQRLHAPRINA